LSHRGQPVVAIFDDDLIRWDALLALWLLSVKR